MMHDRKAARAARSAQPEWMRSVWAEKMLSHLIDWEGYLDAKVVMAYASIGAEVETWPILLDILARGKRLVLPRCHGDGIMVGHAVAGLDALAPGMLGICEPGAEAPVVQKEEIDLILVPGLLFDRRGNRIGQGAGYYDRYLAHYAGMTCALAYAMQVADTIEPKPHDVPVRMLCTEEGLMMAWTEER